MLVKLRMCRGCVSVLGRRGLVDRFCVYLRGAIWDWVCLYIWHYTFVSFVREKKKLVCL